jgi:formamidopyrimidine-DNA glycosylase
VPELPEVEAVTRRLEPARGAVITAAGQFRPTVAAGLAKARARRIASFARRGKNILVRLEGGDFLRVHLKMTGNLRVIPDARLRPSTARVWLTLADGRGIVLDDPRALGRVRFHRAAEESTLFADLGPEPFSPDFTEQHLRNEAARTRKPVKLFLMDQRAVVGLGNIYAAEALHRAGIHPARETRRIVRPRLARLYRAIMDVLEGAVASAAAAYAGPDGFEEGEHFPLHVYGREGEPCPVCGSPVRRIPQAGRSTYYCPSCQR